MYSRRCSWLRRRALHINRQRGQIVRLGQPTHHTAHSCACGQCCDLLSLLQHRHFWLIFLSCGHCIARSLPYLSSYDFSQALLPLVLLLVHLVKRRVRVFHQIQRCLALPALCVVHLPVPLLGSLLLLHAPQIRIPLFPQHRLSRSIYYISQLQTVLRLSQCLPIKWVLP